jgi:hypothetical protein
MISIRKSLFFILIIIILTMAISENVYKEPFVPRKVNEIYRPIARNIRVNYEGFYNKSSINISNFFRKFGIL